MPLTPTDLKWDLGKLTNFRNSPLAGTHYMNEIEWFVGERKRANRFAPEYPGNLASLTDRDSDSAYFSTRFPHSMRRPTAVKQPVKIIVPLVSKISTPPFDLCSSESCPVLMVLAILCVPVQAPPASYVKASNSVR